MLSLTLASIRANKMRFVLTGVAVMLGVAFMAGTLVLTDTIKQSYDSIAGNVYKSTDAVVRSNRVVKAQNDIQTRGTVSTATLAVVRSTPGVRAADPQQTGIAVVLDHHGALLDANPNRSVPIALAWSNVPQLNPMTLVAGHAPVKADDVVIDRASWKKGHFVLGETVHVVSQIGSHPYHLAGVVTYGGSDSAAGGAQVVAFSPQTAAAVVGTPGRYDEIRVLAAPGTSSAQLVANLRQRLRDQSVEVITGTQAATDARNTAASSFAFIQMALLMFAIVALVVGAFVIYNTFSITVAQRTKETAMLRAIGAKRKQVTRSVMIESTFTGIFASAIGVGLGIAAAQGLRILLGAFGMELPTAHTVVQSSAITVSMIVGVTVTVLAAYLPARKAAKVAPIEALRDVAIDTSGTSKRRAAAGIVLTGVGIAAIASGLSGGQASIVGLGALVVFVGVAVGLPVIARPFARLIGAPLPILRGMAGTLARENATRNPRRTAASASALMVGVGLVAFMTVFAASARLSVGKSVDTAMKSNWIVESQFGMGGLSPSVARQVEALPEVRSVTRLRFANPIVNGGVKDLTAMDPSTATQNIELNMRAGDIRKLGLHSVAVQADEAAKHHVKLGDTVTMFFPETGKQRFTVVAIYLTSQPLGSYAVSIAALDANVTQHVDNVLLVSDAHGVSIASARHAIDGALKGTPTATLRTKDEFKGSIARQINQILNLVYVLLAMALLIALFGIANTLALSVYERTHEFGLLRAVGMTRRQVRSTVRWESVLIALLGTVLGTVIGIGFGWSLIKAIAHSSTGIKLLSIPFGQLALIVVAGAVAAVAAAALPARRAARLNVLDAISE
jgi:putative ABC transport system permease protein